MKSRTSCSFGEEWSFPKKRDRGRILTGWAERGGGLEIRRECEIRKGWRDELC